MRRTTRRALLNLTVFCILLFIIVAPNFSSPLDGFGSERSRTQTRTKNLFSWEKVRYGSSAFTPSSSSSSSSSSHVSPDESLGICPGVETTKKPVLVVARVEADGDAKWLDALTSKYHLCVYNADSTNDTDPTVAASTDSTRQATHSGGQQQQLKVPANRGHESMPYLTFLISNYAHLPSTGLVFVHGSRFAWHNDAKNYDNAAALSLLNVSAALTSPSAPGYHNLRCDWSAGTCDPKEAGPAQGSIETSLRAITEPWNSRVISDKALPGSIAALFGGRMLGRSDAVRAQCCAQFVVSRENVWQHSRDEYVALRQWLLDGSEASSSMVGRGRDAGRSNIIKNTAAPRDDRVAGRILSYVWHIIFMPHSASRIAPEEGGEGGIDLESLNALACPSAGECYCRLFGQCGLNGCSTGHCPGQYRLPSDFKLPEDWAIQHS